MYEFKRRGPGLAKKLPFNMFSFGPGVVWQCKSRLCLEPVSGIFSPRWLFFPKPNQKRIKICGSYLVNFLTQSLQKLIIFRIEMSLRTRFLPNLSWFGMRYTGTFRRIYLKICLICLFSFNLPKIKNWRRPKTCLNSKLVPLTTQPNLG